MPKRKSATIPKFGSVDELVQFFDTHDMSRYWKQTPEVKFEPSAVKVKKHFVAIDQQIAAFLRRLPTLKGEVEAEVSVVAKSLSEKPKPAASRAAGAGMPAVGVAAGLDPAANYTAAWKQAIASANQTARTQAFRAMQDSAEQAAPHDGTGIVGFAGVAAGAIFMRDVLPIEKVLLLYEPFASAFPYESLA